MWHAFEHGIYVLDQSGFMIDRVGSFYSQEYAFLMFATDHGLVTNCEAVGAGDGGIYPGGQADTEGGLGRPSVEVSHCISRHNVLGYSGTQGDNVYVHDTMFTDNAVGLVSVSESDHPNYPQNNLRLERNLFYDNNFDIYSPDSDVQAVEFDEAGAGFSGAAIPVGIGVFLPSGNDNLVQDNDIWNNERFGVWLASGQGLVVGPTSEPPEAPFASSGNRFIGNRMFAPASYAAGFNGVDFGWDGAGIDNCWRATPAGTANPRLATLSFQRANRRFPPVSPTLRMRFSKPASRSSTACRCARTSVWSRVHGGRARLSLLAT
ncbi:MAG: right-handed parallel beta-helix repeat-containing protein, partial [Acidimicrobiia bacterium]